MRVDGLDDVRDVLIVGGSPDAPAPGLLASLADAADLVVVCDAGADACMAAGVTVDVMIGDDDSVSAPGLAYARSRVRDELLFPMDKDDVDLGLALRWVRERCPGVRTCACTGVSGGRTDHALAVLGLLARSADLAPRIEENGMSARVLAPQGCFTWNFSPADVGLTASVIALVGQAIVSEEGMRWNLDRATLEPLSDLGVSNVVERVGARLTVHEGVVLATLLRERVVKTRA